MYPASARTCDNDGAPLCPETVGPNWKVEGVLAPRLGGGVFAAFHRTTGVRAAITYFPQASARETATKDRITRELSALRILDKSRGLLSLLEEGSESDGARFLIHELGTLRLLQDLLDEWQKPDRGLLDPPIAAQVVRPLLSTLSTAHRIGVAHASLTPLDIYLQSEGDPAEGITRVVEARLHGVLTFMMGPELRQAVAQDLRAVGATLFELLVGRKPPDSVEALRALPLPKIMATPVGKVAMRALGAADQPSYLGAEEMLRALVTTVPTVVAPTNVDAESVTRVDPEVVKRAPRSVKQDTVNTKPTVPIEIIVPPASRPAPSQPALPPPVVTGPVRSGLTAELRQVSIHDLMKERERGEPKPQVETLARSTQHRASVTDIPMIPPPPDLLEPGELPPVLSPVPSKEPSPPAVSSDSGARAELGFGQEPTIPAVVNPSTLAANLERVLHTPLGSASSESSRPTLAVQDKAGAVTVSVSGSGSLPKPFPHSGPIVIPPQPSGPSSLSGRTGGDASATASPSGPMASLPARPVSRPPLAPAAAVPLAPAPGVPLAFEPTPSAGQPAINPEDPTEPAPAVKGEAKSAAKSESAPAATSIEPVASTQVKPEAASGRDLPPWVWAAILAVVCLLALLAGLFGR